MNSKIYNFCKQLENCTTCLEDDVARSLQNFYQARFFEESNLIQETSKDYHYKEILNHLREIKDHIKTILKHDESLNSMSGPLNNGITVDKEYIKKQAETFQNYGTVPRRLHKPVRTFETSSMKLLECWEMMLEEKDESKPKFELSREQVIKRENSLRKNKKIISSTVETFLESPIVENAILETLSENGTSSQINNNNKIEAINTQLINTTANTKPRVVGLIVSKYLINKCIKLTQCFSIRKNSKNPFRKTFIFYQ